MRHGYSVEGLYADSYKLAGLSEYQFAVTYSDKLSHTLHILCVYFQKPRRRQVVISEQ